VLTEHVARYVSDDSDALIFTGEKGAVLRRSNFNRLVKCGKMAVLVDARQEVAIV